MLTQTDLTVAKSMIFRSVCAFSKPENRNKNRRSDFPCWDHSRILLCNSDFNRPWSSDYINANWVDGYKKKNKFIATQAPMENTVDDFLAMVWQNTCRYIIVLTKMFEDGVEKCFPYWPTRKNIVRFTNQWIISFKSKQCAPGYQKYVLEFSQREVPQTRRTIILYNYTNWSENRRPKKCTDFLRFLFRTRSEMADYYLSNKRDVAPIVVHGSDGINRTVQYCIYDNNMDEIIDTDRSITKTMTIREMIRVSRMRRSQIVFLK